uniref:Toxin candidate TRINITY_DN5735_c0_g1_i1 n=1 Tax=Ceriantheomorphe brasiliensis TaxID=1048506 RepID=A0A7G7WZ05_9CNID|nr:toxin candidate TRINITY_DN5735_c0_g1_i1 [Ceriantheomorphe brasiliensis]QNH72557.1 toxin candidate TRINITY_DN5735_c0_g1_i1 [Ceriantheomorphe brasiliensis]
MELRGMAFVVTLFTVYLIYFPDPCLSKVHCPLACLPVYKPVCASDGKTYDNLCEVGQSNCAKVGSNAPRITVLHDGHCTEDSVKRKKVKCLRVNRRKFLYC